MEYLTENRTVINGFQGRLSESFNIDKIEILVWCPKSNGEIYHLAVGFKSINFLEHTLWYKRWQISREPVTLRSVKRSSWSEWARSSTIRVTMLCMRIRGRTWNCEGPGQIWARSSVCLRQKSVKLSYDIKKELKLWRLKYAKCWNHFSLSILLRI